MITYYPKATQRHLSQFQINTGLSIIEKRLGERLSRKRGERATLIFEDFCKVKNLKSLPLLPKLQAKGSITSREENYSWIFNSFDNILFRNLLLKVEKVKGVKLKDLKLKFIEKIKDLLKIKALLNPFLIEFYRVPLGLGKVYSLTPFPLLEKRLAVVVL